MGIACAWQAEHTPALASRGRAVFAALLAGRPIPVCMSAEVEALLAVHPGRSPAPPVCDARVLTSHGMSLTHDGAMLVPVPSLLGKGGTGRACCRQLAADGTLYATGRSPFLPTEAAPAGTGIHNASTSRDAEGTVRAAAGSAGRVGVRGGGTGRLASGWECRRRRTQSPPPPFAAAAAARRGRNCRPAFSASCQRQRRRRAIACARCEPRS